VNRRKFITLLGSAATWPLAARAQQPVMPVIGFLDSTTAADSAYRVDAFRRGLSEAGYFEGQNLAVEYRWAEGRPDRLPALAADLITRRVAAIVVNNAAARAATAATSQIPIVFVSGGDPVQFGLVTSLNRPGGNVTGVSFTTTPLEAKRLELLNELASKPSTIGVLLDPNLPNLDGRLQAYEAAARAIGRDISIVKAGTEGDFNAAFATLATSSAGALLVGPGAFYIGRRRLIAALATRHALPTIYSLREFVVVGGLMSYGASDTNAYRRGGVYVGRILNGAKAGDLPVELPSKYELVINVATAKAIGLDVPPTLLARADEVIE
jgi:putative ABC transport system substrate-binding protein